MVSIYRSDLNRVVKIIRQLETDMNLNNVATGSSSSSSNQPNSRRLKKILNERCDGNRNIFHAAVFVCAPVSNNNLNNTVSQHQPIIGKTPSQTVTQSSLRPSKFSDTGLSDIYAAYGKTWIFIKH